MKTEMFFSISVTRNSLKFMKLLSIDFALHSYNTNMRLVQ